MYKTALVVSMFAYSFLCAINDYSRIVVVVVVVVIIDADQRFIASHNNGGHQPLCIDLSGQFVNPVKPLPSTSISIHDQQIIDFSFLCFDCLADVCTEVSAQINSINDNTN